MYIMCTIVSNNSPSYTHMSLNEKSTPKEFGNIFKSKWPSFDAKSMLLHILRGFIIFIQLLYITYANESFIPFIAH
jgi:hypothetical protein